MGAGQGRWKSEVERDGPRRERNRAEGAAGTGGLRERKTISNSQVCVGVRVVIRGRTGERQEVVHPIRFGTYNIRNSQNSRLESALHVMSQANVDIGVIQETKLTNGIYTRYSIG